MFATAPQAMVMMAELAIRGPEKIQPRVDWQGLEIIEEMRRNNEKVDFSGAARLGRRYSLPC